VRSAVRASGCAGMATPVPSAVRNTNARSEAAIALLEARRLAEEMSAGADPRDDPVEQRVERHQGMLENRAHPGSVAEQRVGAFLSLEGVRDAEPLAERSGEVGDAISLRAGDVHDAGLGCRGSGERRERE